MMVSSYYYLLLEELVVAAINTQDREFLELVIFRHPCQPKFVKEVILGKDGSLRTIMGCTAGIHTVQLYS